MSNKGVIVVLTIIITALCLFYLSFTFVAQRIQQQAIDQATDKSGTIDLSKKQAYLDSVWNQPVYDLFWKNYTYHEVKDNELSLGLDLQGGMHVVLEISPADILKGLSSNSQDPAFLAALQKAGKMANASPETFASLFAKAYKEVNPDRKLAPLFASSTTKDRVSFSDTDDAVVKFLNTEIKGAIDRSYTIIKTRISQFGTSEPSVQQLQGGWIQIEIPGADNPQRVRKLLQGVARLEFWEIVEPNDPQLNQALRGINQMLVNEQNEKKKAALATAEKPGDLTQQLSKGAVKGDTVKSQLEKALSAAKDSTGGSLDSLTRATLSPLFSLMNPQIPFLYAVKDTAEVNRLLRRADVKALFPRTIGYLWDVKPEPKQTPGIEDIQLNFINLGRNGKPLLTGEVINDARMEFDQFARPAVSMTMNGSGSRAWAKITAAQAAKQPQGRVAIVLDNYVYTAPTVQGEIPNGNSQITGSFTTEEAKDLALVLKAGSLPAPTKIVEEGIIGPTLGQTAKNQGLLSMACGLFIVALFVVVYYTKGGWVANIALLFNIFFILGILAQFNASLTLPGIAGIVLTMGMAIDANVLIYERIKEELRHGRKLREAIKTGYSKAFATILDSNVTTFLTALALFIFGQGPIRGFATVLMVGIATSFFSSIYISHVIIDWIVRKGDETRMSFNSFLSNMVSHRRNFDFVGMRKINYIISVSAIVIGFAVIAVQGLNFGVDFKGGRSYLVSFSKPVSTTDMKVALTESFGNTSTEVKNYGTNDIVKITTPYLIDDQSEEADNKVRESLITGLEKFTGLKHAEQESKLDASHFTISSSTKVGPTVASDIKNSAFKASFFSVIAIFLWILIRFRKWQYSAGAIVATLHDSLFVFSAFAVAHVLGLSFEVDQVFVAAILTVIGYSLNDTVIIFDRIREYLHLGTSHDRAKIFNDAINSTLSRTLITSGTTLTVVIVLLIFGGEVLRGFSFSLL
ncbi:MAG TPA: protein translocase subunit SecDF, partial [Cyclobacteriaceae bacterium]|nr:protein translocase subunit SecDF [Cyclobacteriaceae bacterium]